MGQRCQNDSKGPWLWNLDWTKPDLCTKVSNGGTYLVKKLGKRLKSHEFVIRLGSPSVDFYGISQPNHEELYPFVFDDAEVNAALDGRITISRIDLWVDPWRNDPSWSISVHCTARFSSLIRRHPITTNLRARQHWWSQIFGLPYQFWGFYFWAKRGSRREFYSSFPKSSPKYFDPPTPPFEGNAVCVRKASGMDR